MAKKGIPVTGMTEAFIAHHTYNYWLNNAESLSMIYGDLALYNHAKEEFHKRNAGAGSTGTIYRTDDTIMNFINGTAYESSYAKKHAKRLGLEKRNTFSSQINTTIVKDMGVASAYYKELKKVLGSKAEAYGSGKEDGKTQNEADAQGLITFDGYRNLKVAEGTWSNEHDALFQKIVKVEEVPVGTIRKFFPVIKAQYWGPLQTAHDLPLTAFHKYSLMPMIPSVIKDKNMEYLHDRMVKENITYLTFESGSKVSTVTETKGSYKELYKQERILADDIIDLDNKQPVFTPNVIHLQYLKNQLEIHESYKNNVIFSTQMRKLVEDGLVENGVPTDFVSSPNASAATRKKEWAALSTLDKEKHKNYRLVKNYEDSIKALSAHAKKELLEELNWTSTMVKGEEKLDGDESSLLLMIYNELERQDLGDHALDFLQLDNNGNIKHDLSLSLNVEKIEKLLNALMVKRLIKVKVKGEALIQLATTLMESKEGDNINLMNPTEEDLKKYGSNDLPFYRNNSVISDETTEMINALGVSKAEWLIMPVEEQEALEDCIGGGSPKAEKGFKSGLTRGGTWKVVKDLKGQPSHAEGGVQLSIGEKGGVHFTKGDSSIHAVNGMLIPNKK